MSKENYRQQFENAFSAHDSLSISVKNLFIEGLKKKYFKINKNKVDYVHQEKTICFTS